MTIIDTTILAEIFVTTFFGTNWMICMYADDMWFQQDGDTCYTPSTTMDILHERFEGMVISRRGDVNWPPGSCNLTPLDFFLWGLLKMQVYANEPRTTGALSQHNPCRHSISAWPMRQSQKKLDISDSRHPAETRRPFKRFHSHTIIFIECCHPLFMENTL